MKCFFGNRRWDLLKPNDVFNFRHALSFFSELALSYYSAAWMTCAVLNEDAVDTAIEDLVGILQEADPKLWTSDQRDVIQDWLSYFRERFNETFSEEVDAALRNIRRSHSC